MSRKISSDASSRRIEMTHSEIRLRRPDEQPHRGCRFSDKTRGVCTQLPDVIVVVPDDFRMKRHMPLCAQHLASFKKDQPAEFKRRLVMTILEWRNYAIAIYGGLPTCRCVGCQVVS